MNSEQFTAIVKQAQARFGCTEAQAARLGKSFAADVGNGLRVGRAPGETGLATLRFPDGINWSAMTPAIRLVRLLQHIEAMDKANIGMAFDARFALTPEMDSWLRPAPDPVAEPTKPAAPIRPANTPIRQRQQKAHVKARVNGRCRFCGKAAMSGADVCYTCKSD
jgi:hypothetical protein